MTFKKPNKKTEKKRAKLKKKQRAERGFSDEDTWSFDTYLARVIGAGVRALKDRSLGYPANLSDEEWTNIQEAIAVGFEDYAKNKFEINDYFNEPDNTFEIGFKLFHDYFGDLWD